MFSSELIPTLVVAAALLLPGHADAEQRVYEGTEAQALQCAAYFSFTSYVHAGHGLIPPQNGQDGVLAATSIIGEHVGGTFEQKRAAFQAVLKRMPAGDPKAFSDSLRHLNWCSERFLR